MENIAKSSQKYKQHLYYDNNDEHSENDHYEDESDEGEEDYDQFSSHFGTNDKHSYKHPSLPKNTNGISETNTKLEDFYADDEDKGLAERLKNIMSTGANMFWRSNESKNGSHYESSTNELYKNNSDNSEYLKGSSKC